MFCLPEMGESRHTDYKDRHHVCYVFFVNVIGERRYYVCYMCFKFQYWGKVEIRMSQIGTLCPHVFYTFNVGK